MIISCITDRLGNQLFQYATAKALSIRKKTELKIDKSYYDWHQDNYELHKFCIPQNFADSKELKRYRWKRSNLLFFRVLSKFFPKHTYNEKSNQYDANLNNLGDKVYLKGFWQNYRYFHDIEETLKEELQFKDSPKGLNKELIDQIQRCNSVSLHVRRGDYVKKAKISAIFNVCTMDYYRKAITKINELVEKPHFFIFSDDKEWVKENLKIQQPHTFVVHNSGDSSHEDMRLMSYCKHNIIANSSFSWWGAWLNSNKNKVVVVPGSWTKGDEVTTDSLCPPEWERIDV